MEGVQEMFLSGWERSVSRSQCWFHGCVQLWQVIEGHPYNLYTCLSGCLVGEGRRERKEKEDQLFSFHPKYSWGFPGGPVAKTLRCQCRGFGFNPWSWN